jgi:hypothetical protein
LWAETGEEGYRGFAGISGGNGSRLENFLGIYKKILLGVADNKFLVGVAS